MIQVQVDSQTTNYTYHQLKSNLDDALVNLEKGPHIAKKTKKAKKNKWDETTPDKQRQRGCREEQHRTAYGECLKLTFQ